MVHWDDFRFILALYRHGTMTAAAASLDTNVATVSRRVERVAETLGAPVFQKEGGAWKITQLGMGYVELAEEFEHKLRREENAQEAEGDAMSWITLAGPPVILDAILFPHVSVLTRKNPNLGATFQARVQGDGLGDADVLIRWGKPEMGRLVARKIGTLTFRAYRNKTSSETDWIALEREQDVAPPAQLARELMTRGPRLRVSTAAQKVPLMRESGLVGIIPDVIGRRDPKLAAVPEFADKTVGIDFWYAYHNSRRGDPVVEATTDWLVDAVAEARRAGLDVMPARQTAAG